MFHNNPIYIQTLCVKKDWRKSYGKRKATIPELVKAVKDELRRINFKEPVIGQYNVVWKKLKMYAKEKDISFFSMKFGLEFLEMEYGLISKPRTDRKSAQRIRAVNLLGHFQTHGIVPVRMPTKEYIFAPEVQEPFWGYISSRRQLGISERTIQTNIIYLERFSNYLHNHGVENISEMDTI